ncbi:MAG: class I SAM-dependent methyltransferase [Planctomycetota bacterium]|jgi:hypothetical protein
MADRELQVEIGAEAIEKLLEEFRAANIGRWDIEKDALQEHMAELSRRWNERFPGLPKEQAAYSSLKGVSRRGGRDDYLKGIIVKALEDCPGAGKTIVNPACVWGRHARDLARRLPGHRVIGSDINPKFERFYKRLPWSKTPENYRFAKDDIFNPKVQEKPSAVVFFGACASLSDAAMDYAIESHCPLLICRACCHAMIGGNTEIVKQPDLLNRLVRLQFFIFAKKLAKLKAKGHYFSPRYSAEHYPRSETARTLTNSDELIDVARNAISSDICKTIIDLDRYLHLAEAGYDAWYKAEMFVAQRATNPQRHEPN